MSNAAHFFAKSDVYHRYRQPLEVDIVDAIIQITNLSPNASVLDCGAGTGLWSQPLSKRFSNLVALDPNEEMLAIAADYVPGLETVVAPAETTPFENDSFDLATCARAFHWFDHDLLHKEWHRILRKPKWVAVITTGRAEGDQSLYAKRAEVLKPFTNAPDGFAEGRRIARERLKTFLVNPQRIELGYESTIDLPTFIGREHSKAYFPVNEPEKSSQLDEALAKLFEEYATNGEIHLREYFEALVGTLA